MTFTSLQPDATLPQQIWRQIVRFWTEPMRAEPLAMMRICGAVAILLSTLLSVAPNLSDFWMPDSLLPPEVGDEYVERTGRFSLLYGVRSPAAIITWFIVWCVSLVFLAVGFYTRFACVVAWVLTASFNLRAPFALNGGDDVAALFMFYLLISPCGAAWSIDSFRRRMKQYREPDSGFESPEPRPAPEPVMIDAWPVRLIQIQLVVIYFFNGISKLHFVDGTNQYITGEAVYWALNDVTLTRFSYASLPTPLWLCALLSWATLLFELGFPLFVLFARTRKWLLWGGVLFHLGIFVTMEIGWFGQVMLCFYPALLSGATVARFAARLAGGKPGATGTPSYILYYDTFCPVCRRARLALEILDVGRRIVYRDIHDRDLMQRELPQVSYTESLTEMMVVSPDGKLTRGYDAFRTIGRVLPALWPLLPLLYLPGVSHAGRGIYRWVAKNRFRMIKCESDMCSMHLKALSKEHVDLEEVERIVTQARSASRA